MCMDAEFAQQYGLAHYVKALLASRKQVGRKATSEKYSHKLGIMEGPNKVSVSWRKHKV